MGDGYAAPLIPLAYGSPIGAFGSEEILPCASPNYLPAQWNHFRVME